jgi:pimeloyl-ACP methyl ester carboxylesterase
MSKTVMLVHGAWLTPASFDQVKARYQAAGYTVVAPPWPYLDRPIPEQRRAPAPELRKLSIRQIVDHYVTLIRALPEPPILIGHSFGGLFVQLLIDRGLGAAGACVSPGAPRGVIPGLITLRSALPVFTAFNGWNRVLTMSFKSFSANFAQLWPEAEKRAAYERYIVPAPGRIYYQGAVGIGSGVDYANPHRAPLLLIGADRDRIVQQSMVEAAYHKHRRSPVTTAFKAFPGRDHCMLLEQGWEDVADYVLQWTSQNQRAAAPAAAAARS